MLDVAWKAECILRYTLRGFSSRTAVRSRARRGAVASIHGSLTTELVAVMEGDSSGLRERNGAEFTVTVRGKGFTKCTFTTVPVRLLPCSGRADRKTEGKAVSGGSPAARGCSIEGRKEVLSEGGRGCFGGELPLRGADRLREGRRLFLSEGELPLCGAARLGERRRLFLRELPLRGAARLREGRRLFLRELPLCGAARLREGRRLFLRELPLRGAARLREGRSEAFAKGAPAAPGCSIEGREEALSKGAPAARRRGAARLREGGAA